MTYHSVSVLWMDGWMDRWVVECVYKSTSKSIYILRDLWRNGYMDERALLHCIVLVLCN